MMKFNVRLKIDRFDYQLNQRVPIFLEDNLDSLVGTCSVSLDNSGYVGSIQLHKPIPNIGELYFYRRYTEEDLIFSGIHLTRTLLRFGNGEDKGTNQVREMYV